MAEKFPNCSECIYFYITYDASKPYGCKAMKFKSAKNPAQVVFASSGVHCRMFTKKKGRAALKKDK